MDPTLEADCDDGDENAYPGQTAFFATPRATAGGYDYDCNGTNERGGTGPTQPPVGSCPGTEPCNEGVYFTRSAPPCGGYAQVYTCFATGDSSRSCMQTTTCSGAPSPGSCPSTSGPPQSCR